MLTSFFSEELATQSKIENVINHIHILAYTYHWSREECWNLPCTERQVFIEQIIRQQKAEQSSIKGGKSHIPSKYRESK